MASRSSPAKKDDVKALLGADHTSTSGSPMESPAGGGGSAAHAVAGGGMSNYVSFDGVSSKKTDAFSDTGRDIEAGGESNLLGSKGSTAENNGGGHYMTGGKRPLREQFVAFKTLAAPYFRESRDGRCTFYILVVLTLMNSGVRVVFSYLVRDFYNALEEKNQDRFYEVIIQFMLALLVMTPIAVLYRFQAQRLSIKWRDWMTGRTMNLYYSNRVYYTLERGREIDNPDQRIAEDVRTFTNQSLNLFLNIVTSTIDLVSFSIILATIRAQLFIAIFGYATVGTVATYKIGKKLIRLNYEKLQREADFRYSLVRVSTMRKILFDFNRLSDVLTSFATIICVKNRYVITRRILHSIMVKISRRRRWDIASILSLEIWERSMLPRGIWISSQRPTPTSPGSSQLSWLRPSILRATLPWGE